MTSVRTADVPDHIKVMSWVQSGHILIAEVLCFEPHSAITVEQSLTSAPSVRAASAAAVDQEWTGGKRTHGAANSGNTAALPNGHS